MSPIDPYVDESIGELRNLLNAQNSEELREREAQIVFANETTLSLSRIPRLNNLAEVCAIHRHLFGDIYDWAGEVRTVDITKNSDGSDFFLIVSKITDAGQYVFSELASENYLKDLPRVEFINRLSYYYDQLNYIHPFREGNGRTQRAFWSRVASDAGHVLCWNEVGADENNEASRVAANDMDLSGLIRMFERVVQS